MTKGYITIAVGQEFRIYARNMLRTVRLSGNTEYPFTVITNKNDECLSEFDQIVVINESEYPKLSLSLIKLIMAEKCPYDEALFIEPDVYCFKKLDTIWSQMESVGSPVTGIGYNHPATEKNPFFNIEKVRHLLKDEYPTIQGGLIYINNKCGAKDVFSKAVSLLSDYDKYNMCYYNGKYGDEPLLSLSMGLYNCRVINDPFIMRNVWRTKFIKMNVIKCHCSCNVHNKKVEPCFIHFGSLVTKGPQYKIQGVKMLSKNAFFLQLKYYFLYQH